MHLDAKGVTALSLDDVKAILRGADDLIMRGGRSLLTQLLKGSRRKRLLELGLDESPVFGYFRNLDEREILARIDWVILEDYLRIEYDDRLPLLVYSETGWDIEKVTYVEELLGVLEQAVAADGEKFDVGKLKDKNREMIGLLLEKLQATGNPKFISLLEAWAKIEYKKVRLRIRQVINSLGQTAT